MNEKPPCPKCQSIEVVKNGKVQGKQKDKCNSCSLQFTRLTPRGRPAQEKAMAVTLYTLGLSIRAIAGLIGVSPTAVLKWIKTFAKTHYEDFRFDPMDSCLLRVGTRLSYEIFQGFSPYAGVAWEHEFDGTARTELSNHGVDAPSVSMRGDSAVFMAACSGIPLTAPSMWTWGSKVPRVSGRASAARPAWSGNSDGRSIARAFPRAHIKRGRMCSTSGLLHSIVSSMSQTSRRHGAARLRYGRPPSEPLLQPEEPTPARSAPLCPITVRA